jgi:hypothetical protein
MDVRGGTRDVDGMVSFRSRRPVACGPGQLARSRRGATTAVFLVAVSTLFGCGDRDPVIEYIKVGRVESQQVCLRGLDGHDAGCIDQSRLSGARDSAGALVDQCVRVTLQPESSGDARYRLASPTACGVR